MYFRQKVQRTDWHKAMYIYANLYRYLYFADKNTAIQRGLWTYPILLS
jgi:hypothetical protein